MSETEQKLIEALREAVSTLYSCRYSEQPLAKRLDGLLKEITGKSQADLTMDWAQANLVHRSQKPSETPCRYWNKGNDPGHCQRHPPVPIKDKRLGQWPLTKPADWCGDHEPERSSHDPKGYTAA